MARKRLIKGANAARVEERIARVPADVSIFASLRAMEESARPKAAMPKAAIPKAAMLKAAPRRAEPAAAKPAVDQQRPPAKEPAPRKTGKAAEKPPSVARAAAAPAKHARLGPSDFSNAEREAIIRCCSDYRNHLPIYLLAVQKEVRVIDSVIDKCLAQRGGPKKP